MKILLLGSTGQLGQQLQARLGSGHSLFSPTREQLNLQQADAIAAVLDRYPYDVLVNAAGYTSVDQAEDERELAYVLNATAPEILAAHANRRGALFLHFSTDYVFSGRGDRPYVEDDATLPLSVYGASKRAGELAVTRACARAYVLRTSWVYSLQRRNFLLTMINLMQQQETLRVVDDQIGTPTWTGTIANVAALLIARERTADACRYGTYHLVSDGLTSWHGFAEEIAARLQGVIELRVQAVERILTADYPTAATRPAYSVLSNAKLKDYLKLSMPSWQEALQTCLTDRAALLAVTRAHT